MHILLENVYIAQKYLPAIKILGNAALFKLKYI